MARTVAGYSCPFYPGFLADKSLSWLKSSAVACFSHKHNRKTENSISENGIYVQHHSTDSFGVTNDTSPMHLAQHIYIDLHSPPPPPPPH